MKLLSVKSGIILAIIGLAILGSAEVWAVEWKNYGTNENGSYFYDTESMTRLSRGTVRVWVLSVYTEKGISYWVNGGGKEFQNLDFTLVWSELNCVDRAIRHLRIVFYSKNREVFYPITNNEWHFFAPDSMSGDLNEAVCR